MSRFMRRAALLPLPVTLSLALAAPAQADPERLEQDLRTLFELDDGTLEIGDISSAMVRDRLTAESVYFTDHAGGELWVDRYTVSGDYDAPSEVSLEGIRLKGLEGIPEALEIERLVLTEPDRAVPPPDDEALSEMRFASLSLEALSLAADEEQLASLAGLTLAGNFDEGDGSLRIEALAVDLARLIDRVPEEERDQLRMASNVLTDGSGQLHLDADIAAQWEENGDEVRLVSEGYVDLAEALKLSYDLGLPMRLPEGADPASLMAADVLLETATLMGGDLQLTLSNQGLFPRLLTLGASLEGVSEAQYKEQARTQAEGFGMMLGEQVQGVLVGLVDMMAGSADELEIQLSLPDESPLDSLAADPMALPEIFDMRVDVR